MLSVLFAMMLAPAPDAEAMRLGRRIAQAGTLGVLLPIVEARETDEMVAASGLDAAGQQALRRTARTHYATMSERLIAAEARAYASRLSLADLRRIAAFETSPAAARRRAAMPSVIAATMQTMAGIDMRREVRTAHCRDTGQWCPPTSKR